MPFRTNLFGWEGYPKIGYRQKGTLILTSPLEDLDQFRGKQTVIHSGSETPSVRHAFICFEFIHSSETPRVKWRFISEQDELEAQASLFGKASVNKKSCIFSQPMVLDPHSLGKGDSIPTRLSRSDWFGNPPCKRAYWGLSTQDLCLRDQHV